MSKVPEYLRDCPPFMSHALGSIEWAIRHERFSESFVEPEELARRLIAECYRGVDLKEAATDLLMSAIPALETLKKEKITIGSFKADIQAVRNAIDAFDPEQHEDRLRSLKDAAFDLLSGSHCWCSPGIEEDGQECGHCRTEKALKAFNQRGGA